MTDGDTLEAAVLLRPADETPRLVYADWLDDQNEPGDAARAAFIRVQCKIEETPPDPPELKGWLTELKADGTELVLEITRQAWVEMWAGTPPGPGGSPPPSMGTATPLVRWSCTNPAGGTLAGCGQVAARYGPDAQQLTTQVLIRTCPPPPGLGELARLRAEEARLVKAGAAVCWPEPPPEPETLPTPPALAFTREVRQPAGQARGVVVSPALAASDRGLRYAGQPDRVLVVGKDKIPSRLRVERGFVSEIDCDLRLFLAQAGWWFSYQPIRKVKIKDRYPEAQYGEGFLYGPRDEGQDPDDEDYEDYEERELTGYGWRLGNPESTWATQALPPDLWSLLPGAEKVETGHIVTYPTREAAYAALGLACLRYGRRRAARFNLREIPCGRCQFRRRRCGRNVKKGCRGEGVLRTPGLPDYAPADVLP